MKSTLLPLLGFVFALLGLGAAGYFWRRASSLYALLIEGASRYDALRQQAVAMESEFNVANERLQQNRDAMMRMEKNIDESRARVAAIAKQLEAKEQEQQHISDKLELQKNHLIKQLDAATARIESTVAAKNDAEQRLHQVSKQIEDRSHNQLNEARNANRDLRQQLESMQSRATRAEAATENMTLEEVRLLKRKLAQIERLYAGMKGLRELAEERNHNLETAVRKLAAHTIQTHSSDSTQVLPTTLGPLVGGALELIGAELIDDGENMDFSGPVDAEVTANANPKLSGIAKIKKEKADVAISTDAEPLQSNL